MNKHTMIRQRDNTVSGDLHIEGGNLHEPDGKCDRRRFARKPGTLREFHEDEAFAARSALP
jgi:hypothetical protein